MDRLNEQTARLLEIWRQLDDEDKSIVFFLVARMAYQEKVEELLKRIAVRDGWHYPG